MRAAAGGAGEPRGGGAARGGAGAAGRVGERVGEGCVAEEDGERGVRARGAVQDLHVRVVPAGRAWAGRGHRHAVRGAVLRDARGGLLRGAARAAGADGGRPRAAHGAGRARPGDELRVQRDPDRPAVRAAAAVGDSGGAGHPAGQHSAERGRAERAEPEWVQGDGSHIAAGA